MFDETLPKPREPIAEEPDAQKPIKKKEIDKFVEGLRKGIVRFHQGMRINRLTFDSQKSKIITVQVDEKTSIKLLWINFYK